MANLNLTQFIDQRRPQWRSLQLLLEKVEGSGLRSLSPEQAVQFAALYRRAASDLNQAQTFVTGEAAVRYLNDLVARCYLLIHARKNPNLGALLKALVWGYPAVFRRFLPQFVLATAIFALGAVFGFAASSWDSKTARSFMPSGMATIQPGQEHDVMSTGNLALFSGFLFRHNVSVTLVAFALGMTFGLGTAWLMFENGLIVGVLAAVFVEAGAYMEFFTGILPHGVLEIPACLLGGAGGFVLAEAMLRVKPWPRLQELGRRAPEALNLVAGCVPLLAVAAFIEAVVARAPNSLLDSGLKLAVAAVFASLFVAYLALVGWKWRRRRAQELREHPMLHQIISTEKVPLVYHVAGLGSRFFAWLIDMAIIGAMYFVLFVYGLAWESVRQGMGLGILLVLTFVVQWCYFALFEWLWHGQTPGKRAVGIRVIDMEGAGLSLWQAAVRNMLRVVDGLPLVRPDLVPIMYMRRLFDCDVQSPATAPGRFGRRCVGGLRRGQGHAVDCAAARVRRRRAPHATYAATAGAAYAPAKRDGARFMLAPRSIAGPRACSAVRGRGRLFPPPTRPGAVGKPERRKIRLATRRRANRGSRRAADRRQGRW